MISILSIQLHLDWAMAADRVRVDATILRIQDKVKVNITTNMIRRATVPVLPKVGLDNQELHHLPILTFTQTSTSPFFQNPVSAPEPKPELEYVLTLQKPIAKSKNVKKTRNLHRRFPGFKPLMGDGEGGRCPNPEYWLFGFFFCHFESVFSWLDLHNIIL